MKRWQQEGTEHTTAAILVFVAVAVAMTTTKHAKAKAQPCPNPQASSKPKSILDTCYLEKNIITLQDAAQAYLPHLGPSNTFIRNANRGDLKAEAKTRVN